MGLREAIVSLASGGVRADMPARERKHIVFVNSLALAGMTMTGVFAPMQVVYGDARTLAVYVATFAFLAAVMALNRRGHQVLAASGLCLVAWTVTFAQAALDPREGSVHFFLLAGVFLPYLAISHRQGWKLPVLLSVLAGLSFLYFIYHEDAARSGDTMLYLMTMAGVVGAIATAGHYTRAVTSRAERELDAQRALSDSLLLSILPAPIAERLKRGDELIADELPEVSVLFLDIAGFTRLATEIPADELVGRLNAIVSTFDRLAERYGVEKIKTIGDGYMVAAGVPIPRADHARAIADMALAMRDAVDTQPEAAGMQVRIGIATGPVVAGVIGASKFAYDLWGDTVNTAAKLEETGIGGEIQICEATKQSLGDGYAIAERGAVHLKGKGEVRTHLLEPRRPPAPGER